MTAPLDFAVLPPEINSGRMYAGAGAGPMLAAAAAWNGLAAELQTTGLGYSNVLSELTSQAWHGPASASMAAAAAPYAAWLSTAAAQAEQTAAQAEAAVAAYEAAFAATVPPPAIAANRALLMVLIATNFFGQNTPAIAATEAQYAEMWAQDAAAMYGYAGASAAATQLTPFDPPPQTTDPGGVAAQPAAVAQAVSNPAGTQQTTLSQLVAATSDALHPLASQSATDPAEPAQGGFGPDLGGFNPFAPGSATDSGFTLNGILNGIFGTDTAYGQFLNAEVWNDIFSSGFFLPKNYLGTATDFAKNAQTAAQAPGAGASGAGGAPGAAAAPGAGAPGGICTVPPTAAAEGVVPTPMGSSGTLGASVAVSIGKGGAVGSLSVPPGWTGAGQSPLASALGNTPLEAPSGPASLSTPPVPMAGFLGAQGEGRAVPRYGFPPAFVPRPPAAG